MSVVLFTENDANKGVKGKEMDACGMSSSNSKHVVDQKRSTMNMMITTILLRFWDRYDMNCDYTTNSYEPGSS